jgi:putative acetyltransferase
MKAGLSPLSCKLLPPIRDFKPAINRDIKAPFDIQENAFMAIELVKNGLKNIWGIVKYPNEFNDV